MSPEKEKSSWFNSRRLTMRGLKPSDYFLYKSEKEFFDFDMRQLVVLGLRWIYAGFHEQEMRNMILALANQIKAEDLDLEKQRPEYKKLTQLWSR